MKESKTYQSIWLQGKREGYAEGEARGIIKGESRGIEIGKEEGFIKGKTDGNIEGETRGILKGEARSRKDIAQALIKNNTSIILIAQTTGLSIEQIQRLK